MADLENKATENVAGKFYVDMEECIACDACVSEAEDFFVMGEDYAYVKVQPTDDDGVEACENAIDACPVDAIGDDGDE